MFRHDFGFQFKAINLVFDLSFDLSANFRQHQNQKQKMIEQKKKKVEKSSFDEVER